MRQTLFRIYYDGPWLLGPLGEVPGFGFGLVLAAWVVFGIVWLLLHRRAIAQRAELVAPAAIWLAIAAGIILLPKLANRSADAAIAAADRVLAVDPRSPDAYSNRSAAQFSKRAYAAAVGDLEQALAIDPGNAAVLDRLAWILATCPNGSVRDGARAVKLAQKACDLANPPASEYLATLAAAHAEQGEFAQAIDMARQALRRAPRPKDGAVTGEIPQIRSQIQGYEQHQPYRDRTAGKYVPIFGFGVMLFTGFIVGAWSAGRRGARIGYPPEMTWDIGIWLFIAGVIGCRLFYCIQYAPRMFFDHVGGKAVLKSVPGILYALVDLPDGGLVYYGGIPAGLLAAIWICRRRHLSLLELGDVVIPSLFLGMAFGRIGCFLNGCCYGDRCDLPWGVQFPMGSIPDIALVSRGYVGIDQDLPFRLHPTQLYSAIDGLLLFLLTHAYFPYRPRNGAVIALGALTYPLTRFAVESLRGDELGQFNTSLTISQWISILLFGLGVIFAAWLSRRPRLAAGPAAAAARRESLEPVS